MKGQEIFQESARVLANNIGYVNEGTDELKYSHDLVCQILACLVELLG